MSEVKHTPGPWHVADDGYYTEVYAVDGFEIVDAGQGPHLHENHDGNSGHWATTDGAHIERDEEEERANARLIAAAPEMLEALDHIGGLSRYLRQGGPDPMDLQELSDALEEAVDMANELVRKATGAA